MEPIKNYRGKYKKKEIVKVLDTTRMADNTRRFVLSYLCDGIRLKDLPVSKQHAWNRINNIVRKLEDASTNSE